MISRRNLLTGLGAGVLAPRGHAEAPVGGVYPAVLTHAYDNNRTGWNPSETALTQATVTQEGVKRAYALQMEGDARGCEAQCLIVPQVMTRTGFKLNLAIQASMSDGLWAFNADTGEVVWAVKLGIPVKGTKAFDMYAVNDNWGIIGTPVIDRDTNTLYAVTWSSQDRTVAKARYYAHAINVGDGSAAQPPVDLSTAAYNPGHGLQVMSLGTVFRKQRPALLLINVQGQKAVIVCFAAGAESAPTNHGWVVALSAQPFQIAAAWNDSPRYAGGGIWMGGSGPASDATGAIYLSTGNGSFDGVTDFGETIVKLQYRPASGGVAASLTAADWFTPYTDAARSGKPPDSPYIGPQGQARPSNKMIRMPEGNGPVADRPDGAHDKPPAAVVNAAGGWTDQDLGSSGVLLFPNRNTLLAAGKDGIAYLVNTQAMGRTQLSDFSSPDKIAANNAKLRQALWFTFFPGWNISPTPTDLTQLDVDFAQKTHHQHSTPVYYESPVWGPMVFCCGENSPIRVWQINENKLGYLASSDEIASPNAVTPPGGMTGGWMTCSSNGNTKGTGLLVALFPLGNANQEVTNGFMVIYDPENFDTRADGSKKLRPLWKSTDWGINFQFSKFGIPVIAGGRIFVPTYADHVDVYTLAG